MTQERPTSNISPRSAEREHCFKQLTSEPEDLITRLQLARLFFEDKLYEFAVRELVEIKRRAEFAPPSLERLLAAFGEIARPYLEPAHAQSAGESAESSTMPESTATDTVAELDIDAEFADLLVDLEENDED